MVKITKYNLKKVAIDIVGLGIGIAATAFWSWMFAEIYKHGGVIIQEPNKKIAAAEFAVYTLGTIFLGYTAIRIATGIDKDKYLKGK